MTLISHLVGSRSRDVGFSVRRLLPSPVVRAVGPFVFLDHMGPARFTAGSTSGDVLAHPHIGLATITYLFSGAMVHRDSLGVVQRIEPGDVNWMTAGRGIVHSERIPQDVRSAATAVEGIQMWVALPRQDERVEPAFWHHPAAALPSSRAQGVRLSVLAGELLGLRAPVRTYSPMFYAALELEAGARFWLDAAHAERAAYVLRGRVAVQPGAAERPDSPAVGDDAGSQPALPDEVRATTLAVFAPGAELALEAHEPARLMLLGGEPLDGPRKLWWNFVATSPELIEQARRDWDQDRFVPVPGEETERVASPRR